MPGPPRSTSRDPPGSPSRDTATRHNRHTFASLLLQNRESPAYVKEQMGHSSIQVTVDVYGHLIPGANRQAVDRLDDATGRNPRATKRPAVLES